MNNYNSQDLNANIESDYRATYINTQSMHNFVMTILYFPAAPKPVVSPRPGPVPASSSSVGAPQTTAKKPLAPPPAKKPMLPPPRK